MVATSVGRVPVTVWPPIGELAVGAESVPGVADTPLCVIVKLVPPTVSVAERAPPAFAATEKVAVPLPLPGEPLVIVRNVALLVAVHAQPTAAVTGTDPVPPVALNDEAEIVPAVAVQDGAVDVVPPLLLAQAVASINSAMPEAPGRRRRIVGSMRGKDMLAQFRPEAPYVCVTVCAGAAALDAPRVGSALDEEPRLVAIWDAGA